MKSLLEIKNLSITFEFNDQIVNAVKNSSFKINKGECLAIVGESGSGKSVTALAIMRLIRSNSQLEITGSASFEKKNLFLVLNTTSTDRDWGGLKPGTQLGPLTVLFPRINTENN